MVRRCCKCDVVSQVSREYNCSTGESRNICEHCSKEEIENEKIEKELKSLFGY